MDKFLESPKVTIGITSYNAEKTIVRAINCALNQTWSNKEIIIVDDGSIDSSKLLIKKAIEGKKIKFLNHSVNKGASFSRNQIIKNSNSELICFMDDDDYSDSQRIQKQVIQIIKSGYPNKELIACCTGIKKVYKNGYQKILYPLGSNGSPPKGNELADFLLYFDKKKGVDYGFSLPTCCLMITKKCFESYGYFDHELKRVEDMDLTIRLSMGDIIFTSVREILVIQNADIFSQEGSLKNFKSEIILINKYKDYLIRKKVFEYSLLWTHLRLNYFQFKYKKCIIIFMKLFYKKPIRTISHILETGSKRVIHDFKNNSISFSKFFKQKYF